MDQGALLNGAGTTANPFQIWSCAELQAIENDLGADYIVVQDIDCTGFAGDGQGFSPIGDNANPFTGSLDGAGHTISGLVIDRPSDDWVGLFGVTQGALVHRIGVQDVFVRGRKRVGGLVGWQQEGVIEECFATGMVTGEQYVGGIAGRAQDGSIVNSYARVSVSCTKWDSKANKTNANCGGIIGGVVQGFTHNSYAAGALPRSMVRREGADLRTWSPRSSTVSSLAVVATRTPRGGPPPRCRTCFSTSPRDGTLSTCGGFPRGPRTHACSGKPPAAEGPGAV